MVRTVHLERRLRKARVTLDEANEVYWTLPHDSYEQNCHYYEIIQATLKEIASLHRQFAELTKTEWVVPIDLGFVPEAAVSGASLFQGEGEETVLTFNAMRCLDDGTREEAGRGEVQFGSTRLTQFGLPNDEAHPGHPLYPQGLDLFYDPGEVLNSAWIREAERRNRICFPNDEPWGDRFRHFIFQFHDASFECIASDLSWLLKK